MIHGRIVEFVDQQLWSDVARSTCTVPLPSTPSPSSSPSAEPVYGVKPPIWLRYAAFGAELVDHAVARVHHVQVAGGGSNSSQALP